MWKRSMFFCLLLILSGCTNIGHEIRIQNSTSEDSSALEELFESDDRLKAAVAIFHEKELIMGVRVTTFSRFTKSKIEKELQKKLEDLFPELEVTVSVDSKILLETNKLTNEKQEEKIGKKIKELKSLIKEET